MKFHFALLILAWVAASVTGTLPAQSTDEEIAIITLTGQNRNRTVAGAVNEECGGDGHSAPFGNWGVASNYGDITDTDQFRGWSWQDGPATKLQWNSCTTAVEEFRAPNCSYYNANSCSTQKSSAVVTHGVMTFKTSSTPCPIPGTVGNEQGNGCLVFEGENVSQTTNFMTVYELDWNGNDLVETLYFPSTSVTLTGCTHNECPEKTTGWSNMTSDTSPPSQVEAEFRMKARATLHGFCDWDAGE